MIKIILTILPLAILFILLFLYQSRTFNAPPANQAKKNMKKSPYLCSLW